MKQEAVMQRSGVFARALRGELAGRVEHGQSADMYWGAQRGFTLYSLKPDMNSVGTLIMHISQELRDEAPLFTYVCNSPPTDLQQQVWKSCDDRPDINGHELITFIVEHSRALHRNRDDSTAEVAP